MLKPLYLIPAVFWAFIIFYLCAIPSSELPETSWFDFPGFDKFIHAFLYATFEWLLLFGLLKQTFYQEKKVLAVSLIICIIYGGLIEIFQETIFTDRSADFWDMLANITGALTGVFIFKKIRILKLQTRNP
jgi:VanZ family protein